MTAVLIALSKRKKCAWDEDTVSDVATAILHDFNMLRFEEFIYIFRQGIKGRYSKVTFAELTESDLGIWITKYMETERLEAEELYRNKFKLAFQGRMDEVEKIVPKEKFAELAHKYKVNDILERNEAAPDVSQSVFDSKRHAYFVTNKSGWTDDQLKKDLAICESQGFNQTAEAISFEIKVRAVPKRVSDLADKIIGGGEMNEEDLQLQKNHPRLLEVELNKKKI